VVRKVGYGVGNPVSLDVGKRNELLSVELVAVCAETGDRLVKRLAIGVEDWLVVLPIEVEPSLDRVSQDLVEPVRVCVKVRLSVELIELFSHRGEVLSLGNSTFAIKAHLRHKLFL